MKKHIDQLGREIHLPFSPKRIVSLVPSQTETLVDLGLEENLYGITKFCVHPDHLRKEKQVVGGTKKLNYSKVEALKPDIILCNKEENTEEMVRELEKIAPVHVSDIKTIAEAEELILLYGELFEVQKKASSIVKNLQSQLREFEDFMADKPERKVAYFIWKNPWMVAGQDTFIDYLLKLNKFVNVFRNKEGSRYPEVSLKAVEKANTELILLSTEPYPFKKKHKSELQQTFTSGRVEVVDGEYFSWYGTRLIKAFAYFKEYQSYLCSF